MTTRKRAPLERTSRSHRTARLAAAAHLVASLLATPPTLAAPPPAAAGTTPRLPSPATDSPPPTTGEPSNPPPPPDKPSPAPDSTPSTAVETASPPPPPDEPSPATDAVPLDVVVSGEPRAPGATSLRQAEIRALPGAFGDAFRAIEAMPGVTPIFSGIPYFYVRGAPPGNVGYFIDGIRVPALFHFLGGPAVVQPSLISRVQLHPGGYPAEYGRFAGGIVTGEVRPPSAELHAEATLRLIDAGALVEAPLPGGLGSALAGARYSYTAPALSLFAPWLRAEYWDYQGRVALELSPTERLTVLALGSHDHLEELDAATDTSVPLYVSEFHRVALRYEASLGDHTELQQTLTLGLDRSQGSPSLIPLHVPAVSSRLLAARTRVAHRPADGVLVRAGVDAELSDYAVDSAIPLPGGASLFSSRQDIAVGLFADAVLDFGRGVQLTPGARVDLWGSQGTSALSADVRFAARVPLTPRLRLIDTLGLAHQTPGFPIQVAGLAIAGLKGGLQRSFQTSAGLEADLPLDITGSVTFFHNAFFDLSDVMGQAEPTGSNGSYPTDLSWLNRRALGSAVGMEVHLRRKLSKQLGGFIAYTLSRSTRHVGRRSFAAQFDRTHTLNAALSWEIGRGFRVGARVAAYSGMPVDPFYPEASVAAYGSDRLPGFVRLDARAEKRWALGGRAWISVVAEVQNATASKEPNSLACTSEVTTRECEPGTLGPITLPSLGVEGAL